MLDIYANISMFYQHVIHFAIHLYATNIFCLAPFDSYYLSVKGKCWYPILWQYFHQFRFITQARIEVQNQDSCLQFPGVKNQEQTDWTKTQLKQNNKNPNKNPNKQTNKTKSNSKRTLPLQDNLPSWIILYTGTFPAHSLFQEQDSRQESHLSSRNIL